MNSGAFVTAAKCRLLKLHKEDFHRLETANAQIADHIRKTATARKQTRDRQAEVSDPEGLEPTRRT